MKVDIENPMQSIIHKDIQIGLPYSDKVDSRVFSRLLDDDRVVASYKMYWLLGVLEEASEGSTVIEFKRIVSRMIVYAWFPHLQYRLSFGAFDNLKKPIYYVAEKYGFSSNCNEKELLEFLYKSTDRELNKMMKELTFQVPYRLLSPFFTDKLRGVKDHLKNKLIIDLSLASEDTLYKIISGPIDKIVINDAWAEYLKQNYKLIKGWIYYKIICFLQKRNPNTPAIAFKLEAPRSRNLTVATKLWHKIVDLGAMKDIYTGYEFNDINYDKYGVLSLDHFIPWSFVLHDEMWNLVPTFKNINSAKNDNLLPYEEYINSFCDIQYKAFSYICDKRIDNVMEEYTEVLRLENPYEYYKHTAKEDFGSKLRQCISPLYQIAVNQGFQVARKIF